MTPSAVNARVLVRPELELILCCATNCVGTRTSERIKVLVHEDLDWTYLFEIAAPHGMKPLLYWNLNATCPDAVPQATLSQLRHHFSANVERNMYLFGELLKLLNRFKECGIDAIPFKGPALAISLYGRLEFRQFFDLDILVREQDFLKAKEVLISQGYELKISYGYEESFVGCDNKVEVDLHQSIVEKLYRFQPDFERLWQNLEPVSHAGATIASFSPEDLIVILAVQITKDLAQNRKSLRQLFDMAQLICVQQQMDWAQVFKQARALHCQRMLLLSLFLASEFKGSVLPKEAWQRINADPMVKSLAADVLVHLFPQAHDSCSFETGPIPFSFSIKLKERMQDRVAMSCIYYSRPLRKYLKLLRKYLRGKLREYLR